MSEACETSERALVIEPTVGRVVIYYPAQGEAHYVARPLAAMVVKVHNERSVNLAIFDPTGNSILNPPTHIPLVHAGDNLPTTGNFCTWLWQSEVEGAELDDPSDVVLAEDEDNKKPNKK